MDEPQKHSKVKETRQPPAPIAHIPYDSICMNVQKRQIHETERLVVAWFQGWEQRMTTHKHEICFGGDGSVLKLDCGSGCRILNLLNIMNYTLKAIEFMGCKL